jgi:hypothetical protein
VFFNSRCIEFNREEYFGSETMRRETFWIWKNGNEQDFWPKGGAPVLGNGVEWYSDASSRKTVRKNFLDSKIWEENIFGSEKRDL